MYKFLIPLFALALLVGCTPEKPATTPTETTGMNMHTVIIKTSEGDITLELNGDAAPKTVENFIGLAKSGYYDELTFHRVMANFMIQGGDPNGNGTGGESIFGGEFEDEINAESYGLHNMEMKDVVDPVEFETLPEEEQEMTVKEYYESKGYVYNDSLQSLPMIRGAIAMANHGPNTNGSQFFIIQTESTPWLDGKHTVFGNVVEGMDVVDKIANSPVGAGSAPLEPITFTVEVVE